MSSFRLSLWHSLARGGSAARASLSITAALLLAALVSACSHAEAPKRYQLQGQILAVSADRQELTIKHGDIPGLMPGMTMSYPVASPALMKDRTPGETITATLEVGGAGPARLTQITHTGSAPLPEGTNSAALAEGILAVGDEVPDMALIDQNDRRRSFSEWRGSVTLMTFVYTRCPLPNFCPLMDQNFETIQRAAAEDPVLHGNIKLVSVTFDPEHDTPAVIAAHAKLRHADPAVWTWLTGDPTTISRFVGRFGVSVLPSDDANSVTHNLRTVLIGKDGRILKIYSGNDWTPGAVMSDMRAALAPA